MHLNAIRAGGFLLLVLSACLSVESNQGVPSAPLRPQAPPASARQTSNTVQDLPEQTENLLERLVNAYTQFTEYGGVSKNIHEFEDQLFTKLHTVNNATFHKMVVSTVIGLAAYTGAGLIHGAIAFVIGSYYLTETRIKSVSAILFAFAAYNIACAFKRKGPYYRNIGGISLILGFLSYYNIL